MGSGVFGTQCVRILPGSFSTGNELPAFVLSPRGGKPSLGEYTATGNQSPVLKLPGVVPVRGDPNMLEPIFMFKELPDTWPS